MLHMESGWERGVEVMLGGAAQIGEAMSYVMFLPISVPFCTAIF